MWRRNSVVLLSLSLALVGATLATYADVRGFPFLDHDDLHYVAANPPVAQGLTRDGVAWAATAMHSGNWHPLTWLSHMLDSTLFGDDAGGHHAMSVAIHALNAVLLLLWLSSVTGALGRSALVAALFALHPLHVESVAWISERKDVLSTLFGLLALISWSRYARDGSRAAWAGALLLYSLSLMSKATLVTLPFVLLLLDVWPLGRLARADPQLIWQRVREKLPFFVLAGVGLALAVGAQADGIHTSVSPLSRLGNALVSYTMYLQKTLLPTGLAAFYPLPEALSPPRVILGAALLAGVTGAALRALPARPWLAVGWLWFLGTLVPVIGLVQVGDQAWADRYSYVPLIGLFLAGVWGADELCERLSLPAPARAGAAVVLALACALGARAQVGYWRDEVALFERALAVTEGNFYAHTSVGAVLAARGSYEQATEQYRAALRLRPGYARAEALLGEAWLSLGRPDLARPHLERTRDARLAFSSVPYYLGLAQEQLGDYAGAAESYGVQVARAPEHRHALARLAFIRAAHPDPRLRNGEQAVELARRACELSENARALELEVLAAAYAETGRFDQALATADRALAHAGEDAALRTLIESHRRAFARGRPARLDPEPGLVEP